MKTNLFYKVPSGGCVEHRLYEIPVMVQRVEREASQEAAVMTLEGEDGDMT